MVWGNVSFATAWRKKLNPFIFLKILKIFYLTKVRFEADSCYYVIHWDHLDRSGRLVAIFFSNVLSAWHEFVLNNTQFLVLIYHNVRTDKECLQFQTVAECIFVDICKNHRKMSTLSHTYLVNSKPPFQIFVLDSIFHQKVDFNYFFSTRRYILTLPSSSDLQVKYIYLKKHPLSN